MIPNFEFRNSKGEVHGQNKLNAGEFQQNFKLASLMVFSEQAQDLKLSCEKP